MERRKRATSSAAIAIRRGLGTIAVTVFTASYTIACPIVVPLSAFCITSTTTGYIGSLAPLSPAPSTASSLRRRNWMKGAGSAREPRG